MVVIGGNLGYIMNRSLLGDPSVDPNKNYRDALACASQKASVIEKYREKHDQLVNNINLDTALETLKAAIGFSPVIDSSYSISNNKLLDRNGIEIEFQSAPGTAQDVLIALHGKWGVPAGVLCQRKDYSNCFGKYWNDAGFHVYALSVEAQSPAMDFQRLGLSLTGSDLAKIEDFIRYLRDKHGRCAHIAIAGISYGAMLAELSAFFFNDVNGLASIGGGARYSYVASEFSLPWKGYEMSPYYVLLTSEGGIYKLLNRARKPVVVSVGIADAGLWGESGGTKFGMIDRIQKSIINKDLFILQAFLGNHEANPMGEIESYKKIYRSSTVITCNQPKMENQ